MTIWAWAQVFKVREELIDLLREHNVTWLLTWLRRQS